MNFADVVFEHSVANRRYVHDFAGDDHLLRFGASGAHHGDRESRTWLPHQQIMNFANRHFPGALAFDGLNDVGVLQSGFVGGSTGNDRDDRSIAKELGNRGPDVAFGLGLVRFVLFVLSRAQIAGIRVQRFQQPMQSAVRHRGNVGLFHIFAAHPRQHFAVHLELRISAVFIGGANGVEAADYHEQQHCGGGSKNGGLNLY